MKKLKYNYLESRNDGVNAIHGCTLPRGEKEQHNGLADGVTKKHSASLGLRYIQPRVTHCSLAADTSYVVITNSSSTPLVAGVRREPPREDDLSFAVDYEYESVE